MLPKRIKKALFSWEREIFKAITTGKGKYKHSSVSDLYDYLRYIKMFISGREYYAARGLTYLDTFAREDIPVVIYTYIEKIVYDNVRIEYDR